MHQVSQTISNYLDQAIPFLPIEKPTGSIFAMPQTGITCLAARIYLIQSKLTEMLENTFQLQYILLTLSGGLTNLANFRELWIFCIKETGDILHFTLIDPFSLAGKPFAKATKHRGINGLC